MNKTILLFLPLRLLVAVVLISAESHAASFDCTKATSTTEKMICSNERISQLDEQMAAAYKKALDSATDKEIVKKQQVEWIKQQRACTQVECLQQAYIARVEQLSVEVKASAPSSDGVAKVKSNTSAPSSVSSTASAPVLSLTPPQTPHGHRKNNFRINHEGAAAPEGMCEEYLKLINQLEWDELSNCKTPNFSGSPLEAIDFKPLMGEARKKIVKMIYDQIGTPERPWDEQWSIDEKEFEIGYRKIAEAYWDIDSDGQPDQVIEIQIPLRSCVTLPTGVESSGEMIGKFWSNLTKVNQVDYAKVYGYQKFDYVVKNGEVYSVSPNVNFRYKGVVAGSANALRARNGNFQFKDNYAVSLHGISAERDDKNRTFQMTPVFCVFSLMK